MANVQAVFYTAPNSSGTGTIDSPMSLTAARDKVRTINSGMTGDIIIYLRGGTYTLSSSLTLTRADSGTNGFNVIYKAYAGETPIISGGKVISGWTLYDSAKNIYKAVVPSLNTRQLFVNGVRAIRARGERNPAGFTKTVNGYTSPATGLYSNMASWRNVSDIEFNNFWEWKSFKMGVASISGRNITMKKVWKDINPASITWIENAFELLDSEGEWYLSRSTNELFYKPRAGENMATATVVAPVLETLISATGTLASPIHHIQFYGITFSYATWLAPSTDGYNPSQAGVVYNNPNRNAAPSNLEFRGVNNIGFERNVFTHLGATAMSFEYGAQNNTFIGNKFEDISGGAIRIGGVSDAGATGTAVVKNNTFRNNFINKIGLEYHDCCAVFVGYTDGTIVDHNEIQDVPYTGVSVGWGWSHTNLANLRNNRVTNNLIHDFMNVLRDGGGVYMLSRQDGTVINNNYIHHNGNEFGTVYLDAGCENITISNNVLAYNFSNYIFIQNSQSNNAYNAWNNTVTNTFVNSGTLRAHPQNKISGTTVVSGDNWPAAARSIINNAGLESAYADIKNGTPIPVPPNVTKYEAEHAALYIASPATDHKNYSGTSFVANYVTKNVGASTTFTVNVTAAGTRNVTLRYSNGTGSNRTLSIYVNGAKIRQTILPVTANWDVWSDKTETLPLNAGTNTIAYKYDPGDTANVNLDYISVDENPPVPTVTKYEAEHAALYIASPATDHKNYSGTSFVANYVTKNVGASTTFTVNVTTAGTKNVTLKYSNGTGSNRTLSIYVNGAKIRQTILPVTANWDVWSDKTETLPLNAGTNTIAYKYDPGDTANVNLDYILVS